jgi:hypothetical protein
MSILASGSRGMISGILYIPEDSSVAIDGQLLKEGDMIYGVEVVQIDRDNVLFQKDEHSWTQRIRERPSTAWQEPETGALGSHAER